MDLYIVGCYGLKQAARLAHDKLIIHLRKYGYSPDKYAPNIWSHHTLPTKFCLCVDDFGIKSFSNKDTQHLIDALKDEYDITVDYEGKEYCGLHMERDCKNEHVDISMPKFVQKTLEKLQHEKPTRLQHAPHKWTRPIYGHHQ